MGGRDLVQHNVVSPPIGLQINKPTNRRPLAKDIGSVVLVPAGGGICVASSQKHATAYR